MELPSKLLEQIPFNTKRKMEEHMLVVMDHSTHEEKFSQPLQTCNKQFKIAVTFLTGYNGFCNVAIANNKFYFIKPITDKDSYIQISIPPGAYEVENLINEIKTIFIEEELSTEVDYPFLIQPNFSTVGSIIEISTQGPVITFVPIVNIGDLLGFNKTKIYEEYSLSPNPVDIL